MLRATWLAFGMACVWVVNGQAQTPEKKGVLKKPLADFAKISTEDFVKRFDKDGDGKIDSEEAPPFLAKRFKDLDRNQDGKLDRDEVRAILQVIRANSPGSNPMGSGKLSLFPQRDPIDFDALDKNADGRLSRDELKGTSFEPAFGTIDTDNTGSLTRREFENWLLKKKQ